jgi:hypothetical protein
LWKQTAVVPVLKKKVTVLMLIITGTFLF